MKKIVSLILGVFLFGQVAFAENATNFWKLSGTTLYPLKSTWSINVAGGITFGASTMAGNLNMANHNILDIGSAYFDADNNSGWGSDADNIVNLIINSVKTVGFGANYISLYGAIPIITTNAGVNLTIIPGTTGISKFGDAIATPLSVSDNDDVLVTGGIEVGETIFTGGDSPATNRRDVPWVDFSVTNADPAGTAESLPIQIDGNFILTPYSESDGAGGLQNKEVRVVALRNYGRLNNTQGADVASATNTTLSTGNVFEITGTTKIDLISSVGWQEGAIVRLVCNESVDFDDGTASSGTNITMVLAGGADFSCTADDVLTLVLSSTTATGQAWREVSRSVN